MLFVSICQLEYPFFDSMEFPVIIAVDFDSFEVLNDMFECDEVLFLDLLKLILHLLFSPGIIRM
jgi:hypothetical protein